MTDIENNLREKHFQVVSVMIARDSTETFARDCTRGYSINLRAGFACWDIGVAFLQKSGITYLNYHS